MFTVLYIITFRALYRNWIHGSVSST